MSFQRCQTIVFVLSTGHSGSTWASYVLASHPLCDFVGEYYLPFHTKTTQPCNYCASRNLTHCEILGDLTKIKSNTAFDLAFERTGKDILIDCSKNSDWTKRILMQNKFNVKCLFLIRDPRGWYASHKRRYGWEVSEAISKWLKTNRSILEFVKAHCLANCHSYTTVFYDDLAVNPEERFKELSKFIGITFNNNQLNYWNFPHHGPAGNGASYNILHKSPTLVTTGDNSFYQKNFQKRFYDKRWKQELSSKEITTIENSKEIRQFLASQNRNFEDFN